MSYGQEMAIAELARSRTEFILEAFRMHIPEIDFAGRTVYSLGSGDGEELLHLRTFVGSGLPIIAVENEPTKRTRISCRSSNSRLCKRDIRDNDWIINKFGIPGLIVVRAPRIAESMSTSDGSIVSLNEWWLHAIPDWVGFLPMDSAAYISTFSLQEADLIERALCERGFDVCRNEPENKLPEELVLRRGQCEFYPEKAILTVQV